MKISIPDPWLIAVADDRTLGATVLVDNLHSEFTATLDVSAAGSQEFSRDERKEARKAILKKGLRIARESEEAFHGLPSFQVQYEGKSGDRTVKGLDLWVVGTKARWLFNIEGDVSLYNHLTDQYADLLSRIQFI